VDATDPEAVAALMRRADAVVSLLPVPLHPTIARLAVDVGIHFVNTSYVPPELIEIGRRAADKGLTMLPEFGFDPGIDLLLAGQGMRELDTVQEYYSYGAGFPEPRAANNPLRYKISWTFTGVLKAYIRDGRIVRDGRVVEIPGREMFAPQNIHMLDFGEWGTLEAYPNGDVTQFLDRIGVRSTVQNAARYAARLPGHCAFWYIMDQMGFLDEKAIAVDGVPVAPREFVRTLLEPQLQYADDERDVALLRVDVRGIKNGRRRRFVYDLSDVRDLDTGLMAMNRTVGYTASIGVQMVLRGEIAKRGLLSPLTDVPVEPVLEQLRQRGIRVECREEDW
jgi:saccharopine dehydrogenase-like NADP-dependent oxidoreductase